MATKRKRTALSGGSVLAGRHAANSMLEEAAGYNWSQTPKIEAAEPRPPSGAFPKGPKYPYGVYLPKP